MNETNTVNTTTTTVSKPLPAFESLAYTMRRDDVIALCVEKLGKEPPKSWNRTEMAKALHGRSEKRSSYAKMANTAAYTAKTGCVPTKSWSAAKIANATETGKAPGGSAGKASAVAAYVEKMGTAPTKSWSAQQCLTNATSGKLPGAMSARGGITVATLKKWATDHNLPGRSKATKKDDILALLKANFICCETGAKLNVVSLVAA